MSLTADDFADFMVDGPEDNEDVPLGDTLKELAVNVEVNPVEEVRDARFTR